IMGVKEAVDNSLDACEEASILPDIAVDIEKVDQNEYKVTVEDNGPGIVPKVVPNVFGKLLYGSRFHSLRQSRGQQGIGISATVMYGQITTGKPATITSKTEKNGAASKMEIKVNTKKNEPDILSKEFIIWDEREHGTRIEFYMTGRYVTGKQSVLEYLKQTAIVNPHSSVIFTDPEGKRYIFQRATDTLPPCTKEIRPHPQGIELGTLMNMAKLTSSDRLSKFLRNDFNRISERVAKEICEKAWLNEDQKPQDMTLDQYKQLLMALSSVKIMAPQTDCLSPIGETLIRKGLKNVLEDLKPEFYAPPVTRQPSVYAGNPFLVEVGVVYGGNLSGDQPVTILRFANRVPLLYQQGACVVTKAIEGMDWRRYGLEQRGGEGVPYGPAIILVHVASTKIPFTSEAKEAVANIPEIQEEIQLALKACGRKLKTHLNKRETKGKTKAKFEIVQEILPLIAEKSAKIVGKDIPSLTGTITKIMNVVWIDDSITFENGRHKVRVKVYNYTPKSQTFSLHAVVPEGALDEKSAVPRPSEVKEGGKMSWELKRIPSTGDVGISFDLTGLDA
ncbi:MAG: DNA topoisomerase VI subunit B, partial [Euryarchaeota archaeon]|nr:DNA topoisomerase VI subunit B [Euryarchaeota archaeon]